MAEEQYTRCPGCRTVFRVTPQQLAIRAGQVRCGHCQTVFDGVAQLVSLAPRADDEEDFDEFDEAALGPPTVTLRSAQALAPAPSPDEATAPLGPPPPEAATAAAVEPEPQGAGASVPDAARPARSERPAGRRHAAIALHAAAALLLLLLLAGQAAYHFRDLVVTFWPAARPAVTQLCAALGCRAGPPREIADLAIQASDLQADPAHQGLLILTATLRNRGAVARAYPMLELTLTDAQDQVVVRRALTPAEYAGGTTDVAAGIPAYGEVSIKLFIDASATTQAGYRLYLFYA